MTRMMGATAITLSMTGMAFAEAHTGMFPQVDVQHGQAYLASTLIGTPIYAVDQEYEMGMVLPAGTALDWDDIGEIGDVVISAEGELEAIIIDVGGFLGLGEREVAVSWNSIRPVTEDDDLAEVFLTIGATEETLNTAPEFQRAGMMSGAMVNPDAGVTPTPGLTESVEGAEEAEAVVEARDGDAEVVVVEGDTAMEAEVEETMVEVETAAEEAVEETGEAMEAAGDAVEAAGDEVMAETAEAVEETEMVVEGAAAEVEAEAAEAMETTTEMVEVETVEVEAETMAEGDAEVVVVEEADMATERTMLRTPMFEREGFVTAEMGELTTEDMTGMRLYDPTDEDIGEISELIMAADGTTIESAILDIGGFLGLGEHQVLVTMDELQILRGEDGGFRAYIDATQEELEAQPEYEG